MGFIIWSVMSGVLIILGLLVLFSKRPVPFWNVCQKIEVLDIKKYNIAVGRLWIGFGCAVFLLGIPLLKGQNSPWIVLSIIGTVFSCIGMMGIYTRIEKKYRIIK